MPRYRSRIRSSGCCSARRCWCWRFFPGIAYWASNLLGFQSPINFVYVVIIFLLLAKLFLLSIRVSQLDSRLRILTEQVALNQEKQESEKLDL